MKRTSLEHPKIKIERRHTLFVKHSPNKAINGSTKWKWHFGGKLHFQAGAHQSICTIRSSYTAQKMCQGLYFQTHIDRALKNKNWMNMNFFCKNYPETVTRLPLCKWKKFPFCSQGKNKNENHFKKSVGTISPHPRFCSCIL